MSAWLHIVGIGEDGLEGLLPAARAVVQSAQVIIGGDRHHQLAGITSAERLSWPSPFDALISTLHSCFPCFKIFFILYPRKFIKIFSIISF